MSEAINRVIPLEKLRWVSFGHIEADECGAMNMMLAAAPTAEVIAGPLAVMLSLTDLCDRPPVVAPEDGVLDIGGHRLRFIPTPHVPHNWEAGLWFDETTSTLLAGDLFTHIGRLPRAHRIGLCRTRSRGRGDLSRDGADNQSGADAGAAGGTRADHAGDDARVVVHRGRPAQLRALSDGYGALPPT